MKPENEKSLIHCLLIALAIFIPYHQVAQHRFIEFDDGIYAFGNIYIIRGLTWESLVWAFTNTDTANWHPLTWLTHLVDRELFGPHAGGYFLMNVAWHTCAACLCYMAFFRCTQSRFFALTVALIFALHPVNVENVAWASERKSLVDAVFWFLGILAYFEFVETRQRKFFGILIITHCLGLMGKAMHVTFPCAIILLHLLNMSARENGRALSAVEYRTGLFHSLKIVWPLLILTIYFSAVTASAQSIAMSNLETHSIGSRLINVLLSYQRYLEMFFHPRDFAPFYPLFFLNLKASQTVLPITLLLTISAALIWLARHRPTVLLGWCWFLGTMVPVVGLVQVGSQSHADRYLYIPMIGLSFIFPELFSAIKNLSERTKRAFFVVWLGLVALSLGSATHIQTSYWRDGVALFSHSLRVTGDCLTAVNCLSSAYLRLERYDEAIAFLDTKIVVAENPDNIGRFHSMKAQAYMMQNKQDDVISSVNKSIEFGRKDAINHWLLANVYFQQSKYPLAKVEVEKTREYFSPADKTSIININIGAGMERLGDLINDKISPSESFGN